jgi:hypothetical protein
VDLKAQKMHCLAQDKTVRVQRSISHCVMNCIQDFSIELNARCKYETISFLGKRSDEMMEGEGLEGGKGILGGTEVNFFGFWVFNGVRNSIFVRGRI